MISWNTHERDDIIITKIKLTFIFLKVRALDYLLGGREMKDMSVDMQRITPCQTFPTSLATTEYVLVFTQFLRNHRVLKLFVAEFSQLRSNRNPIEYFRIIRM